VGERPALINQLRVVLLERDTTAPKGRRKLEQTLTGLLDGPDNTDPRLNPRMFRLVADMRIEWVGLDERIAAYDEEFAAFASLMLVGQNVGA
jgi:transposase